MWLGLALAAGPAAAQGDLATGSPYPWNSAAGVCDRAAGPPEDVNVQLSDLVRAEADLAAAVAACRDALATAPDDLRLRFQAGRTLLAAGERAGLDAIESAARAGYAPAELFWGLALQQGRFGLPAAAAKALVWVRRAAEGGNAWALVALGQALAAGEGVARDPEEAERLLRQAFRRDASIGAVPLAGFLFEREQQLYRTDREAAEAAAAEAKRVLLHAGARGLNAAKFMLALVLHDGGATFEADKERAFDLMHEAADGGLEIAIYWMAMWLYDDAGGRQDRNLAAQWVCKLPDPQSTWRAIGAETTLSCDDGT